jgi:glycosyltransferase involved in cell wall biosynthesis
MNPNSHCPAPGSYVIVTAAYNEEKFIHRTIQSVVAQTVHPLRWIIVSDASTDRTDEIVLDYVRQYPFIVLHRITEEHPRNFTAQVFAINTGFRLLEALDFDFIGNLDADIRFGPDYFERLLEAFIRDSNLGLAGGSIQEQKNGVFQNRLGTSPSSVAHAVQLFRRSCFDSVRPYVPMAYGGPDWIAEVRARQFGWKVKTLPDLPVHHYRPTAGAEGILRGRLRQGRMDHSVGSLFLFEILKCGRRLRESPHVLGAAVRFYGYWSSCLRRAPLLAPDDFVDFLRREQRQRLKDLLGRPAGSPLKEVMK